MRAIVALLLVGCGTPSASPTDAADPDASGPNAGTVVFTDPTGRIQRVDVASGAIQLVDPGMHGRLSITRDGNYVAYVGPDEVVKVADRAGSIRAISSVAGCHSIPAWGPNYALSYCFAGAGFTGIEIVPTIDAPPRRLAGTPTISSDGLRIAYLDPHVPGGPDLDGDVVVENIDGTDRRIVLPDSELFPLRFAAGDELLVAFEFRGPILMLVTLRVVDGVITDLGSAHITAGGYFGPIRDGSVVSSDGTELLVQMDRQLVAVNLTTGVRRVFAELPERHEVDNASFIDANRVVYERREDRSVSDIGIFQMSIHVATDGGSDVMLRTAPNTNEACHPAALSVEHERLAITCGTSAELIDLSGNTIATAAGEAIAVVPDGSALISYDGYGDGTIAIISADDQRAVGDAIGYFEAAGGTAPFVDYAAQ